ncbi:RDD family protein [Eikenella sp. S3360]|uniref:RDD family protein n=1 Tax=Eikenella glucosivorans TaxID=2766967 RepID=A0ABS0N8E4_9NEIS|nr:RDD family protein [Eikenella glucosivorans]MBH5328546.1 RDD family protein [Eikenella glucosivorans]
MLQEVYLTDGSTHPLAPVWKRIAAAAFNFGLAYALLQILLQRFPAANEDFRLVLLPMLAYLLLQTMLMSLKGQSLGKWLFRIRVLDQNGSNPGFFGTVLARETAFVLLLLFFRWPAGLAYLICLIMLLIPKFKRRTLQDRFMGSVVVSLPKSAVR